jgi:peroxiredoxin
LAAFYALRHNVAEQYVPQLNGYGITLAHYTSVLDGLQRRYPDSPYIEILKQEMDEALAIAELTERVEVVGYPDIELEDIYKKKHRLSSLDGKVIMLYFWSAENALCNQINAELKAIYEKYHERGFEVYHVSADSNSSIWIEAVRQQRHPWISVYGGATPELFSLYNIGSLPAVFLIDREGNIESCDFAFSELEKHIEKLL